MQRLFNGVKEETAIVGTRTTTSNGSLTSAEFLDLVELRVQLGIDPAEHIVA